MHSRLKEKNNNIGMIRTLAALQVCVTHSLSWLGVNTTANEILELFPGVPIFFILSGFLIYNSFHENEYYKSKIKNFYIRRIKRIYPALIVQIAFVIISVLLLLGLDRTILVSLLKWSIAQISLLQFYSPSIFDEFGAGNLNGSLWSISVELQFYLLLPILYWIISRSIHGFIVIFVACLLLYIFNSYCNDRSDIFLRIFNISVFPWLFLFMLGIFVAKYDYSLSLLLRVPFWIPFLGYVLLFIVYKDTSWGNKLHPVAVICLCSIIFKFAIFDFGYFTQFFQRYDPSYGMYIFHMPLINILLKIESEPNFWHACLVIIGAICLGFISWLFVERRFLKVTKVVYYNK